MHHNEIDFECIRSNMSNMYLYTCLLFLVASATCSPTLLTFTDQSTDGITNCKSPSAEVCTRVMVNISLLWNEVKTLTFPEGHELTIKIDDEGYHTRKSATFEVSWNKFSCEKDWSPIHFLLGWPWEQRHYSIHIPSPECPLSQSEWSHDLERK